jgi:hypothetical protein
MSDYKLKTYVHAVELDSDGKQTGRAKTLGPDDDLSASENKWALAAISNPDVWEGEAPPRADPPPALRPDDELARLRARVAELEAAGSDDSGRKPDDGPEVERPHQSASREKWVAYARTQDAPDDELAALDAGGLTRDRLREKYGA